MPPFPFHHSDITSPFSASLLNLIDALGDFGKALTITGVIEYHGALCQGSLFYAMNAVTHGLCDAYPAGQHVLSMCCVPGCQRRCPFPFRSRQINRNVRMAWGVRYLPRVQRQGPRGGKREQVVYTEAVLALGSHWLPLGCHSSLFQWQLSFFSEILSIRAGRKPDLDQPVGLPLLWAPSLV